MPTTHPHISQTKEPRRAADLHSQLLQIMNVSGMTAMPLLPLTPRRSNNPITQRLLVREKGVTKIYPTVRVWVSYVATIHPKPRTNVKVKTVKMVKMVVSLITVASEACVMDR